MNRTDQAVLAAMIVGAGAIGVGIFLQTMKDHKEMVGRVSGLGKKGLEALRRNVGRGDREDDEEALPA